jgi:hypothetical protein
MPWEEKVIEGLMWESGVLGVKQMQVSQVERCL